MTPTSTETMAVCLIVIKAVQRIVAKCTDKPQGDGGPVITSPREQRQELDLFVVSHTWRGVFQRCGIFIPLSRTGDVLMSLVRLITNSNKSRGKLAAFVDGIRDGQTSRKVKSVSAGVDMAWWV